MRLATTREVQRRQRPWLVGTIAAGAWVDLAFWGIHALTQVWIGLAMAGVSAVIGVFLECLDGSVWLRLVAVAFGTAGFGLAAASGVQAQQPIGVVLAVMIVMVPIVSLSSTRLEHLIAGETIGRESSIKINGGAPISASALRALIEPAVREDCDIEVLIEAILQSGD